MKNLACILAALVLGTSGVLASGTEDKVVTGATFSYGNPFIFVENGITFSVYPDGEFDFYIDNRVGVGANVNIGHTNITFNSGYNYDPYVQYDDYGAVIQIENVPVYYDYYGRVNQIGDVNIWYRNGRVNRIGGLYVYYNNRGLFSHYTGYVNVYNRHYVYRPFHGYFIRPAVGFCLVYNRPYRRYYAPVRYTYYRPYAYNTRRAYARIGHPYTYNKAPKRASIYRNDKRVAVREHGRRNDQGLRSSNVRSTDSRQAVRTNNSAASRRTEVARNEREVKRSTVNRSGNTTQRQAMARSNSSPQRNNAVKANARSLRNENQRSLSSATARTSPDRKAVSRSSSVSRQTQAPAGRTVKAPSRTTRSVATSSPKRSSGNRDSYSGSTRKQSVQKSDSRAVRSSQGAKARSKSTRVQ